MRPSNKRIVNMLTTMLSGVVFLGFMIVIGSAVSSCDSSGGIEDPVIWWSGVLGGIAVMTLAGSGISYLNTNE